MFDLYRSPSGLARLPDCTLRLSQAKEGIKRKIAKGADQREVFDAVVSVQRQLILFHERKEAMQLLMDRSLAVLAHLRKEEIQVGCCGQDAGASFFLSVCPNQKHCSGAVYSVWSII